MPERLIKQMKKLDGFNASQEWQDRTRNFLVNKVIEDTLSCKTTWNYNIKIFFMNLQDRLVPAPAKAISFLLLIGLISGTGMAARASYKPNTMLYSVWEMVERAELVLATTPTSQTKVYLKHVEQGVRNATKLANSTNLADAEKGKHINTVVTKLKKELNAASASLDIAEQTKQDGDLITALAKEFTTNTKNTVEALNQVLKDSDLAGVNKVAVDEAIATTELVESEAIKLLLNGQDLAMLSDEEIQALVVDKISRATEQINKVLEYLNKTAVEAELNNNEEVASQVTESEEAVSEDVVVQTNEPESQVIIPLTNEQIAELNQKISETQEFLDMAKASLEESDLNEALKNVVESNQIISQINNILGEVFSVNLIEVIETDSGTTDSGLKVEGAVEIKNQVLEPNIPTTTETTTSIIEGN